MFEGQTVAFDPRWKEYDAEEWSNALVASMNLGGVEHIFFVSGAEIAFYQESVAKAQVRGWPAPKLITVPHEGVALNAALGCTMISGQPSVTAAHVDVGTLNYGAALHSAWRGGYPVLMTAGTGPRAYPGSMLGARNRPVQWVQEPRDQGGIVRQYTKLDHRLEHQDNPGLIVSRMLQVAMSEPQGPVYLAVPRETAMLQLPKKIRFPTRDELGISSPAWPDPAEARRIAEWLVKAENPCVFASKAGRNPESVAELVRLAELLALPVTDTDSRGPAEFSDDASALRHGPRLQGRRRPSYHRKPHALYAADGIAASRGEDRLDRRRPGAVALQNHGVSCGYLAGGSSRDRIARHLRCGYSDAHPDGYESNRRAQGAFGRAQAEDATRSRRNCAARGPAPADASALGRLSIGQNSRTEQHYSRRGAEQFRLCPGLSSA